LWFDLVNGAMLGGSPSEKFLISTFSDFPAVWDDDSTRISYVHRSLPEGNYK